MPGSSIRSRPLHLQTIETLFAELISGASVSVGDEDNTEFSLDNPDSRATLNWYRLNRAKWSGNVMAPDVEALVSSTLTTPAALATPDIVIPKAGRRLRLAKLIAHRFAGIHAYGTSDDPPPDFIFEPREPITLFEGWNGSGKTSLLNAVIWCLTGEILRPQRKPESGQEEFDGFFVRSIDGNEQTTRHALTPVTPLPNPASYMPPFGRPVPVDSWVELTFVDETNHALPPVRRTQLRSGRGKISETESGFNTLGVDPIALRMGTVMPALLQFLRVGSASDLGVAVAKLTGLADVSSLAKHATKTREKLGGEFRKAREDEINTADAHFLEARLDLQKRIDEYPSMAPPEPLPIPSAPDLEQKISALQTHFETQKADALSAAQTILGLSFDPADKKTRDDLEASIGPAVGQLKSLAQLPNVRRSRALTEVTEAEWQRIDSLVAQIRSEATVLAELATTPKLARRRQLYARIANWVSESNEHDTSLCPVCSRSLDGVLDPVTQQAVSDHLAEVSQADQRLLSLTKQNWATGWEGIISAQCPPALQPELTRDLPALPRDLIRAALVDDLFDTPSLQGTLSPLKTGVASICDQQLSKLPDFFEPQIAPLPTMFDSVSANLLVRIKRLARARAFSHWRAAHITDVSAATKLILHGPEGEVGSITELTPIAHKLAALASIVKGVAPLNSALELCQRMKNQLKIRREKETRLELYRRATAALASVIDLGTLAERQVDDLRKALHNRASYWRDRCYRNSYPMAGHALRETSMDMKGVLDIRVGFDKAHAPAQHISNASALRANLMGFFLAFWEYVVERRGGIATLVLDDPQELLDHDNKGRLARLLVDLAKSKGAQLLVATYDRHFAHAIVDAAREHSSIEHLSVHPVNPSRERLGVAPSVEELDIKRKAYREDKDNAQLAQTYANEVRSFLETRLTDLFDDPAYPAYIGLPHAPTLADHLAHLRNLIKNPPCALFKCRAVLEFSSCKALAHDSDCMRILNTAHHLKSALSAGDVFAVADELDRVRKLAEQMHREFRHWRWNEPLQKAGPPNRVVPFISTTVPGFSVPIYPDLAAFTANAAHDASQDAVSEVLDESWFSGKSLFLVRCNNLGFSLPSGCVAIVESAPYDGKDHDLVVARQQGHFLARRLFRPPHGDEVALAAEAPDPRESRPTLQFNAGDVALHRIVGMLTEQPPPPALAKGEAVELTSSSEFGKIRVAYRVRNESGVPLALPNQVVLGGDSITKNELVTMEGALIALFLDDGRSVFKRVGKPVPDSGGRLWQFESIGGLGASLVVSLVEPDENSDAPRFVGGRRILGVLYSA